MIDFKDENRPLVVITTQTSWNEVPRMRHYVAKLLSKNFNVLFVELDSIGLSNELKISDSLVVWKVGFYIRGIWRIPAGKLLFDKLQAFLIGLKLKRLSAGKKIILNFKFDFTHVYSSFNWTLRYYFMNDDFVNMPPEASPSVKTKKRLIQNETISYCSRIFVSSGALSHDIEDKSKLVTIILSGHDFNTEKFIKPKVKSRPLICFMGFIHDTLEVEWFEFLACSNLFDICLIGPIESEIIFQKLSSYHNISFKKPLVGLDLQIFLSEADVFIMPYKVVEINTKASVPAKLFQYLACGRPIVSGPMPNLIKMPSYFVYQASNKAEFLSQIERAINEDDDIKMIDRIDYAMNNTWEKRGEQMSNIIFNDLAKLESLS
jgi:glycosyltransferase involved in cell wall biosynthesis